MRRSFDRLFRAYVALSERRGGLLVILFAVLAALAVVPASVALRVVCRRCGRTLRTRQVKLPAGRKTD